MNGMSLILKEAHKKGYRVTSKGNVIGLRGHELSRNTISTSGYHFFTIRYKGLRSVVMTHRLQAYQKFGDKIFEGGIVVRHFNGNSIDNSVGNIKIGSQSQNQMDRSKSYRVNNASNPKHNHSVILEDRANGMTYSEIMDKHNISSKGTISFIINKSLYKER